MAELGHGPVIDALKPHALPGRFGHNVDNNFCKDISSGRSHLHQHVFEPTGGKGRSRRIDGQVIECLLQQVLILWGQLAQLIRVFLRCLYRYSSPREGLAT